MTVIIPEDGGAVRFLARSLKTRSAFQGIWNSLDHFSLPYRV